MSDAVVHHDMGTGVIMNCATHPKSVRERERECVCVCGGGGGGGGCPTHKTVCT